MRSRTGRPVCNPPRTAWHRIVDAHTQYTQRGVGASRRLHTPLGALGVRSETAIAAWSIVLQHVALTRALHRAIRNRRKPVRLHARSRAYCVMATVRHLHARQCGICMHGSAAFACTAVRHLHARQCAAERQVEERAAMQQCSNAASRRCMPRVSHAYCRHPMVVTRSGLVTLHATTVQCYADRRVVELRAEVAELRRTAEDEHALGLRALKSGCMLHVGHVACRTLHVACRTLHVACRTLHVACRTF
jgi:hypothetical protein